MGLKGSVEVELYSGDASRLGTGTSVHVGEDQLTIDRVTQGRRDLFNVFFEGVETRDDADLLRGRVIEVPEDSVPAPPEGTYYHYQLIGSDVRDENGESIGRLSGIMETGANDVYVVSTADGGELLIPATRSKIRFVDTVEGVVGVNLQDEAATLGNE